MTRVCSLGGLSRAASPVDRTAIANIETRVTTVRMPASMTFWERSVYPRPLGPVGLEHPRPAPSGGLRKQVGAPLIGGSILYPEYGLPEWNTRSVNWSELNLRTKRCNAPTDRQ
jgi:hypothetical protein